MLLPGVLDGVRIGGLDPAKGLWSGGRAGALVKARQRAMHSRFGAVFAGAVACGATLIGRAHVLAVGNELRRREANGCRRHHGVGHRV
jgi:hypothetical protein